MTKLRTSLRRVAWRVARPGRVLVREGVGPFVGRVAGRISRRYSRPMLVAGDDAFRADWTSPPDAIREPAFADEGPLCIGWLTSPPGPHSGGHQNMFRFIRFAEEAGHRCRIYLYDRQGLGIRPADVRRMLESSDAFSSLDASIEDYDPGRGVADDVQALVATGWETAYPSFLDRSRARRFYFVQDFEPMFYPMSTEYVLAENTYRFGFHGLTAGGWLSTMLADRYGMSCDHYDFGADVARYRVLDDRPRGGVFFYARPTTPRRGFDLGVMALRRFAEERPDATIHFAGEGFDASRAPFPHINHGSLPLGELNALYNECAAGLVISLSNLSLLPLELLSAGVTPVVNDGPNNRLVADVPSIAWSEASPGALARALVQAYDRNRDGALARGNAATVAEAEWSTAGDRLLSALVRETTRRATR